MRYRGKISNWKDDKGFGFVTPNGGGPQVFVHIKSFASRQQRPAGNEIVSYELRIDAQGRQRAENVAFVDAMARPVRPSGQAGAALWLAPLFLAFVAGLAVSGKLPFAVLWLYLAASLAAFFAYGLDKSAARNNRWRTAESTLHLFGLIGGWPGALIAQRLLRHKSSKTSFQVAFWLSVILNCTALGWLLSASGAKALRSVLAAV